MANRSSVDIVVKHGQMVMVSIAPLMGILLSLSKPLAAILETVKRYRAILIAAVGLMHTISWTIAAKTYEKMVIQLNL